MIRTSLSIDIKTRNRLVDICKKNETYDSVINKLLDHYHNFTIKPNTKTITVVAGTKEGKKK